MTLRVLPLYIIGFFILRNFIKNSKNRKPLYVNPSILERFCGILCLFFIAVQIYAKSKTNTMIFLLNPCHVFTFWWGIVLNMKHSIRAELVFLFCFSNISGPTIGMIFAENDELETQLEIVSYWLQHVMAAFGAPLVCLLSGRFSHSVYTNPIYLLVGYQMFSSYMRFFLTPISALTWANLNHTLCGIDNDPWRRHFQLGKYYFFWAEFYLLLGAYCISLPTYWLARIIRPSVFLKAAEQTKIKND